MEGLFSEWVEWHKCFFTNNCSIFDIPDAIFFIDVVISIIVGSCGFALKRWIKGEKVFTRKGDPGSTPY